MSDGELMRLLQRTLSRIKDAKMWGDESAKTSLNLLAEGLENEISSLPKCPKCGSVNTKRVREWTSDVSGAVYAIDMKCLECGNDWSW